MNHVYFRGNIYFHGALEGHKVDAVGDGVKVSFTAVKKCDVNPSKLSTAYESVIAFGHAQIVKDDEEKREALVALIEKFAADYMQAGLSEIESEWNRTNIFKITIDYITAKFHRKLQYQVERFIC